MSKDRGIINHRARAKQIRDFSGLLYEKITPTDVDGLIEYKNRAYVILEIKYGDAKLPAGQDLALTRLTDDLERSGKPTLCIVASHQTSNCNEDINVAKTVVRSYRYKGHWWGDWGVSVTSKELIDFFLQDTAIDSYKLGEFIALKHKKAEISPLPETKNKYYEDGIFNYKEE